MARRADFIGFVESGDETLFEYRRAAETYDMRGLTKKETIIAEAYWKINTGPQACGPPLMDARYWTTVRGDEIPSA